MNQIQITFERNGISTFLRAKTESSYGSHIGQVQKLLIAGVDGLKPRSQIFKFVTPLLLMMFQLPYSFKLIPVPFLKSKNLVNLLNENIVGVS